MGEKVNSQTSHHKNWFSVLLCYHSKLHRPFAVLIKATIKTFSCFIQKWLKPRRWAAKLDTATDLHNVEYQCLAWGKRSVFDHCPVCRCYVLHTSVRLCYFGGFLSRHQIIPWGHRGQTEKDKDEAPRRRRRFTSERLITDVCLVRLLQRHASLEVRLYTTFLDIKEFVSTDTTLLLILSEKHIFFANNFRFVLDQLAA